MRCVSSRTLVPQWVYQKCSILEKDWYHLTDLMNDPNNDVEWSKEDNYFYFIDNYTNRELVYSFGVFSIVYEGRVVKEIGVAIEKNVKTVIYDKTPKSWTKKPTKAIPIVIDNIEYRYKDNVIYPLEHKPLQMNDFELYSYYNSLTYDELDVHFVHTHNLVVSRGLLSKNHDIPIDMNYCNLNPNYLESIEVFDCGLIESMQVFDSDYIQAEEIF